jgi:hypothetical protein
MRAVVTPTAFEMSWAETLNSQEPPVRYPMISGDNQIEEFVSNPNASSLSILCSNLTDEQGSRMLSIMSKMPPNCLRELFFFEFNEDFTRLVRLLSDWPAESPSSVEYVEFYLISLHKSSHQVRRMVTLAINRLLRLCRQPLQLRLDHTTFNKDEFAMLVSNGEHGEKIEVSKLELVRLE